MKIFVYQQLVCERSVDALYDFMNATTVLICYRVTQSPVRSLQARLILAVG